MLVMGYFDWADIAVRLRKEPAQWLMVSEALEFMLSVEGMAPWSAAGATSALFEDKPHEPVFKIGINTFNREVGAGYAGSGEFVQKTQMRLARIIRNWRREQRDDTAIVMQYFRHPGQERLEFEIMLPIMPIKNGLGFLANALRPTQEIFRAGTMKRARVKPVRLLRQSRRVRRRFAPHDRKPVLAQCVHQFAAARAKMQNDSVGGVQTGFIMTDDGFARAGFVRFFKVILLGAFKIYR